MMNCRITVPLAFLIYILQSNDYKFLTVESVELRFTNLKCQTYDKTFTEFDTCKLVVIKRGLVALNVYMKMYKLPVNNFTMGLQLWKKVSDYRPFLYNMEVNYCTFLKNRRRFPVSMIFMDIAWKYINFNHNCPYNHDIIVKDLVLREEQYRMLPLPSGEYMVHIRMSFYNQPTVLIKSFFLVRED